MIALLTACSFTRAFGNIRKSLRILTSNSEKFHSGFTGNGTTLISKPIILKWEPNFSTKITSSASTRLLIWKFPTYFPHGVHRSLHTTPGSQQNKNENQENQNNKDGVFVMTLFIITLVFILSVYQALGLDAVLGMTEHISWSHFVEKYLVSGEVVQISMISRHSAMVHLQRDAVFDGKRVNFLVIDNLKNPASLEEMLRREESRLNVNPLDAIPINSLQPSTGRSMLTTFFWTSVLLIGGLALFMKNSPGPSSQQIFKILSPSKGKLAKPTGIFFKDVAGMKEAKEEVMEFVHFLKKPSEYKRLGAKMPKGCLLTGPPGVGKTLLAKAVASESGVPFIPKSGSDFVEMIGGLGAKRVRDLFQEAREMAPCIIYIDELDAIGAKRGKNSFGGSDEKDQTLNQILVEMDGMLSAQHDVIVLASTNRPDILDSAILRPGRFDRHIYIHLPSKSERKEILDRHLSDVKLEKPPTEYSEQLAAVTPGMSGADLANIANMAAIQAATEGDKVVKAKHLDYAVERVIAGAPKSSTAVSPKEQEIVATHESGHALIGWLLEHTDVLAKVSIIPRTNAALGFSRSVPSDRYLHTQEQMDDNMCMALGGRAAEDLIFGNFTQGAQDDLRKVTDMAYAQVQKFGFNQVVGPLSFTEQEGFSLRPYSEHLANTMDQEVRTTVKAAYERAKEVLGRNRDLLVMLSKELLQKETLNYEDVVDIIGPPLHSGKAQVATVSFGPIPEEVDRNEEANDQ